MIQRHSNGSTKDVWAPFSVTELTQDLLDSYHSIGGINYVDGSNLPSKRAIADITSDLLHIPLPWKIAIHSRIA
jgi:hypothetical protein